MLVSFFSLVMFTSMSSDAGVLADDHALVDLGGRRDQHGAALLQVEHRERGRLARTGRRPGTGRPAAQVPAHGP